MNIRLAVSTDIADLMRIEQSSSTAAHWPEARYRALFDESARSRLALVAETRQIAGFLIANCTGCECEIENVVVADSCRRQGVGRALVGALLEQVAPGSSVYLEVRESNLAARMLYEDSKFQVVGRRPRYYSQPQEDALIYRIKVGLSASKSVQT